MQSPAYTDYLKTVNQTLYDQIKTADQKAAYIFTFLIALLVWSTEMRKVFLWMSVVEWPSIKWALSLLLLISLAFALVCAALVLLPRNRPGGVALYWGAWPDAGARLARAAASDDPHFIAAEYVSNVSHLAAICQRKYRYVSMAFRGLVSAILCRLALLAIG